MSYRNDHDAAVARVDALQYEVDRLAEENTKLRVPGPPRRRSAFSGVGLFGGAATALIAGVVLGVSATAGTPPPAPDSPPPSIDAKGAAGAAAAKVVDMPVSLAECADAIARRPVTELREPLDSSALERTGAACRPMLRTLSNAEVSGRDSVTAWANAEDQLANRISLLVVYYSSDPATLDNYATAPQMWTEYDKALTARNAALAIWRSRR